MTIKGGRPRNSKLFEGGVAGADLSGNKISLTVVENEVDLPLGAEQGLVDLSGNLILSGEGPKLSGDSEGQGKDLAPEKTVIPIVHQRILDQDSVPLMIRQTAIRFLGLAPFVQHSLRQYQKSVPHQTLPWKVRVDIEDLHETWTSTPEKWQEISNHIVFFKKIIVSVHQWDQLSEQEQEEQLESFVANKIIRQVLEVVRDDLGLALRHPENVYQTLVLAGHRNKIDMLLERAKSALVQPEEPTAQQGQSNAR